MKEVKNKSLLSFGDDVEEETMEKLEKNVTFIQRDLSMNCPKLLKRYPATCLQGVFSLVWFNFKNLKEMDI